MGIFGKKSNKKSFFDKAGDFIDKVNEERIERSIEREIENELEQEEMDSRVAAQHDIYQEEMKQLRKEQQERRESNIQYYDNHDQQLPNQAGNSSRQGFGKEVLDDGSVYEGDFQNGEWHGEGTLHTANGEIYQGVWVRNKIKRGFLSAPANGMEYSNCTFENMIPNGRGHIKWSNGTEYEGSIRNAIPDGMGTQWFGDGSIYEGPFKNGVPHGNGNLQTTNGEVIAVRAWNGDMERDQPGMSSLW